LISSHSGYSLADRIGLEKIPHVIVGHKPHDDEQCQVLLDDFQAGKEAAEYLISLGHEKIAMVSFSHSDSGHAQRHAGYVAALKAALPKKDTVCIQFDSIDQGNGASVARRLFSGRNKPTAVIITSEELALGFQREIRAMGISVPNELSIIGFEDGTSLTNLDTPLTVMQIPSYELGCEAAAMLFRELPDMDNARNPEACSSKHLTIPLMVRRSTAVRR
jgi:LacI family transcriptional regulator